jgi:hypothetical protein
VRRRCRCSRPCSGSLPPPCPVQCSVMAPGAWEKHVAGLHPARCLASRAGPRPRRLRCASGWRGWSRRSSCAGCGSRPWASRTRQQAGRTWAGALGPAFPPPAAPPRAALPCAGPAARVPGVALADVCVLRCKRWAQVHAAGGRLGGRGGSCRQRPAAARGGSSRRLARCVPRAGWQPATADTGMRAGCWPWAGRVRANADPVSTPQATHQQERQQAEARRRARGTASSRAPGSRAASGRRVIGCWGWVDGGQTEQTVLRSVIYRARMVQHSITLPLTGGLQAPRTCRQASQLA